ncbi:reticulon-like protein B11 [Mangifera indica]|uniref:reticulon-like protein B11 n=1 Tax=Mangifera indica TaxID=29780 RepID=UPI001CF9A525|nr:reticulon-like protein B11 [Mangifera indica]XP_044509605.1 reticulon-like protein B11 [Mangifera indica]
MEDSHRLSVHRFLGGGLVADTLLWKKPFGGIVLLASATALWLLFELGGYNLLSFISNVLLLLISILFLWGKSASLLNRPLPPIPDLEISDQSVAKAADAMRAWINYALSIAHDVAVGRNLKFFVQVAFVLLVVSFIGNLFNFLTLIYIGVLLSLSVPVLYDKYQDHIDEKLCQTHRVFQTQYRKIEDNLRKRIPLPQQKEKKIQ